jgi:hypothetical protein
MGANMSDLFLKVYKDGFSLINIKDIFTLTSQMIEDKYYCIIKDKNNNEYFFSNLTEDVVYTWDKEDEDILLYFIEGWSQFIAIAQETIQKKELLSNIKNMLENNKKDIAIK